jgi:hypothetical protein
MKPPKKGAAFLFSIRYDADLSHPFLALPALFR